MTSNQPRKRGCQLGNQNAKRATYQRLAPQPSISGGLLESFIAKLALELDHEPSEDEAKAKAKALCFQAITDYIGS